MNSTLTPAPSRGTDPSLRKSPTFEEVREQVQEDERGKWDAMVRRRDIVCKDGQIAFPLDPLGEYWEALTPTPWATGQLCAQLGIPVAYFRRCPGVLQDIQMNYWLRPPLPTTEPQNGDGNGNRNGNSDDEFDDGYDFTRSGVQRSHAQHSQGDSDFTASAVASGAVTAGAVASGSTDESQPERASQNGPADFDEQATAKEPARLYDQARSDEHGQIDDRAQREQWLLRVRQGTLRAVLSERYSPLDNPELMKCLAPLWQEHFRIDWFALGDEALHLRVIDPTLVQEGLPQDDLMAGVHISNSEVGRRAVTVDAMVFRLVCSNGLIRQVRGKSLLRQRHIHLTPERLYQQLAGAVQEGLTIAAGFMAQLTLTAGQPITDVDETMKRLGERWHLSQGVQERTLHSMRQEPAGVQETVYGLVNGLTRAAQELSMDHRYDLEVLAGRLAEYGLPSWARISPVAIRSVPVVGSVSPARSQAQTGKSSLPPAPYSRPATAHEAVQHEAAHNADHQSFDAMEPERKRSG